ncbi:MAG: hypothetical protein K6F99_07260 [Lachnospiraceae bacterium]|nr:hypothetical protein [Lachnospiraceae bacterium]
MRQLQGKTFRNRNKKEKKQNALSFILITVVMGMLLAGLSVDGIKISRHIDELKQEKEELDSMIAQEKTEEKNLKQLRVYVTTNEFKAKTAESSIGIVNDDEILFMTDDTK